MIYFLLAALFGGCQAFLTKKLIQAVKGYDQKRMLLFFAVKFFTYAVGIFIVMSKFLWNIGLFFCGYAVGLPITAMAMYIYHIFEDEFKKITWQKILEYIRSVPQRVRRFPEKIPQIKAQLSGIFKNIKIWFKSFKRK